MAAIDRSIAEFTIIPHTYSRTTLSTYRPEMWVNLEVDILAKHLEKLSSR